jgi:FkbM family methyltransferase
MVDSVILPDHHDECVKMLLDRLSDFVFNKHKVGVLHIGAHMGEEVPAYRGKGMNDIYLVEANPEMASKLEAQFGTEKTVKVISLAVSDRVGEVEFIVHTTEKGSVESASLLPLAELGRIVPVFNSEKKHIVPTTTLDLMAKEESLYGKIKLLALDVQGAELMVLSGGSKFISSVDAVICEVNLIETYEGCSLEADVDKFFSDAGFTKELAIYHELYDESGTFPAWGECLWVNNSTCAR